MNTVVAFGQQGKRAAQRIRPLITAGMQSLIKIALAIGKEWDRLPDPERDVFCTELGWSRARIGVYAKVGREFPAKQKLLGQKVNLDVLGIEHMSEIVQTPDKTLRLAAKAGMFQRKEISKRDVRKLRQTGAVPVVKPIKEPTPAQAIKYAMANAEIHMNRAGRDLARILNLMEANHITQVKGTESRLLVEAFEKLCAQMAAASPKTSKRAFRILRGEA